MEPVLELLKLLNKSQLTRFAKYLKSPFFGQSDIYYNLFLLLKETYPSLSKVNILKSKSYEYFLSKHKLTEVSKNHWSRMRERLENFIAHEMLEEDALQQLKLQLSFYKATNNDAFYFKNLNKNLFSLVYRKNKTEEHRLRGNRRSVGLFLLL